MRTAGGGVCLSRPRLRIAIARKNIITFNVTFVRQFPCLITRSDFAEPSSSQKRSTFGRAAVNNIYIYLETVSSRCPWEIKDNGRADETVSYIVCVGRDIRLRRDMTKIKTIVSNEFLVKFPNTSPSIAGEKGKGGSEMTRRFSHSRDFVRCGRRAYVGGRRG